MPKKRENPEQWAPCILTIDAACTILQFWSRHCWEIADFRNFRNKKDTVSNYTATLKQIEKALSLREIMYDNQYQYSLCCHKMKTEAAVKS